MKEELHSVEQVIIYEALQLIREKVFFEQRQRFKVSELADLILNAEKIVVYTE